MTIAELRKLLKDPTLRVFVWVTITADDGQHMEVSRTAALKLYAGQDGSTEARAVLDGTDLLIG